MLPVVVVLGVWEEKQKNTGGSLYKLERTVMMSPNCGTPQPSSVKLSCPCYSGERTSRPDIEVGITNNKDN